ncbi:hypothetical protein O3G_MSEX001727 [Manduca sexta]|uniref:Uncharacterized protein n=1 Tax=Manduca sexta TaxID=7130 RepID=A0A922CCS3_MANSE|nr:hypothetical protein O3G_MSEX001727 [Manduca sexta]
MYFHQYKFETVNIWQSVILLFHYKLKPQVGGKCIENLTLTLRILITTTKHSNNKFDVNKRQCSSSEGRHRARLKIFSIYSFFAHHIKKIMILRWRSSRPSLPTARDSK